ncbi:BTB/POZ domain-containing protein 1-like [Ylistrum balloti]|uniref:BTB/POZ domain-containing protein 1-like n=1 Tax=Ylistrum balloti TaxID=509963 RepID=UPI002905E72C|nr:BTB/POZ domain-containing protein 1-like [Ylistrum balloti]
MAIASSTSWQIGKTLSECFDHVFTSGIISDVTFLVGENNTKIEAHKLILVSRSPVFYAMLEGPMAEKGEITIPDISEDIFKLFLRYLYTDEIVLTEENVAAVFNVARKYSVDILVSCCEEFLTKHVAVNNACMFLEHAHVFMIDDLKSKCLEFISAHPLVAFRSPAFTDLCLSCVNRITELDDLRLIESDIYEAIVRWAEAECARQNVEATPAQKREVLGEILYNVRYLHVDEEFLLNKICADRILKSDDIVDVINHRRSKTPLLSKKLDLERRSGTPTLHRINRIGNAINDLWDSVPRDEGISFKSSTDVYLHGFGSFNAEVEPSTVDLQVFEENVSLLQTTKTLTASQPDTPYMGDVLFDQPIRISTGKTYTVVERAHKGKIHYFENGRNNVTYKHVSILFSNTGKSRHTTTATGQIPYLIISV